MAASATDGWDGIWVPPPKNWTPSEEVFKPMTPNHKDEWIKMITSPNWVNVVERVMDEDAAIEQAYATHKFDTKLMDDIRSWVFHNHELDNFRSFRAFDIYKKKQEVLLKNYLEKRTLERYNALLKDIGARGHLIDEILPSKP
jgi:hypothetical protein